MISVFGSFTSYQVNVDQNGQNILGDAANECVISVDPTDGNKMVIAWRQFNNVTSNFRQGGWAYTTDAGVHWTFPGVLQNNVFRSDPVTKSDETGNFFYLSLQSNVQQSFFCDDLWRSTNGGQTWVEQSPDRGAGGGDKQWFTIDKTTGPGHGFQYQSDDGINCSGGGVEFQRSTNGGVTWQSPINIPNSPIYGTLDVDTNGNLFVGGEGNTFFCERSSNAQIGGQTPTFDRSTAVNMGGDLGSGGINGVGLTGMLFLAIDRSGGPTNNNIYMLASVVPPGRSTTDVMFVRSTDGGLTFSAPHKVNDDPVNPSKWHWFGTFAVAPNGRLDAVWYDTRNAANNTDSQLFYSYSTDAGVTWSANVAVSNSFNPFEGYPNQNKIGDYITIVSDNIGGNVAYSATFNFNPARNQHEEDVYYVRVAPAAPMAQSAFSRKIHGAAGTFDVPLPLTGNVGVECRSGGATNDYQMIINFASSVTVESALVTSGTGSVSSFSVSGSQVTVNLTGVTNVQRITVTLHNVNNGTSTGDVPVSMGVLVGDVNGNAAVSAADVALTKSQVGATVSGSNFREDVNANGTISSTDVALVKAEVGTALPP
ncbi:MAG: dockerin type I domain-containing protein [Chthoniobacterales bacterium]